jgi:hypothetical protein
MRMLTVNGHSVLMEPLFVARPVQGDEIVQGVGCSNILQRFKLVSKVALITGELQKLRFVGCWKT